MADLQSLTDRLHYANRREYTHHEGNIDYLDGSPLRRPLSLPRTQKFIAFVIVLVAIALGVVFLNTTVFATLRESAEAEANIAANLEREASFETLPKMSELINLGNDDIRARFQEAGFIVYDASDESDPDTMLLYKLPADMGVEEAAVLYAKGIGNLSPVQATKLLNGSWSFSADRNGITSMVVRYTDFTTGDPQAAVQKALAKEGFDPESVTESGEDDSGNTFCTGTLDADGTACTWKISALPLSEMYSIAGMPEDACYIGVRVTVQ